MKPSSHSSPSSPSSHDGGRAENRTISRRVVLPREQKMRANLPPIYLVADMPEDEQTQKYVRALQDKVTQKKVHVIATASEEKLVLHWENPPPRAPRAKNE